MAYLMHKMSCYILWAHSQVFKDMTDENRMVLASQWKDEHINEWMAKGTIDQQSA